VRAEFAIPGFELVHTVPRETTLATPDLRDAAVVWKEMFDSAQREIVFGQFYVAGQDGEALDDIMAHLEAAGRRGVKIRFLMEKKGEF
ncbi:phospholipase D-like domain-containing protein, partial [Salmonella enterica]